jgi:rare lipoprotein A
MRALVLFVAVLIWVPAAMAQGADASNYDEVGLAFVGLTDHDELTGAHATLPTASLVRVTNLENGKVVVIRLVGRGDFQDDRIIDVSPAVASALRMDAAQSIMKVRVQYIGPAPAPPARTSNKPAAVGQPAETDRLVSIVRPGEYWLQAGSFADSGSAFELSRRVGALDAGKHVEVRVVEVNGSEFFRVMVGPYTQRTDSELGQKILLDDGIESLVVPPR